MRKKKKFAFLVKLNCLIFNTQLGPNKTEYLRLLHQKSLVLYIDLMAFYDILS